jgi:uncharacterized membrane protein YozB (DUF420 family)
MTYHDLPAINACLNFTATVLLILGFRYIKNRNVEGHYRMMTSAMVVSALFLACYLTYHTLRQMDQGIGHTVFPLGGMIKTIYYAILIPHIILAVGVLPFVLVTFFRGLKSEKGSNRELAKKHRRLARYTFPVWLFVSVTGVIVYLMLYQLPKFMS